jgi:hypothetical protein
MKAVYVKYQVDPSFAETNAENIRKVMSDLREAGSDGVRYQSFRQSDGVTFVELHLHAKLPGISKRTQKQQARAAARSRVARHRRLQLRDFLSCAIVDRVS